MTRLVTLHRPTLLWLLPPVALAILVMAVQGRVAAPVTLAAAVTLPWLFLSKEDRFRLLGLDRPEGDDGRGPVFVGAAILLAVVGTLGGLWLTASLLLFGVQPHLLVAAVVALAITVLGPVVLSRALWAEADGAGRRWMAGYCFAVLAFLAVICIGVYVNDVFGPF